MHIGLDLDAPLVVRLGWIRARLEILGALWKFTAIEKLLGKLAAWAIVVV